jgi:hypothetical protein
MKKKQVTSTSGAVLAMSAAALVSAGCVNANPGASAGKGATTDLAHCYNVNVCGGHNDCKSAGNACAGKASCKGAGFVAMPTKACADVGGTVKDEWRGSVKVADLVHCYDVNICGGHNDCKTAENACAGKASCKGHGFVAMPAKACADIGGKEGA